MYGGYYIFISAEQVRGIAEISSREIWNLRKLSYPGNGMLKGVVLLVGLHEDESANSSEPRFVVVRQYTPRPKDEDEFVTKEVQTDRRTESISWAPKFNLETFGCAILALHASS